MVVLLHLFLQSMVQVVAHQHLFQRYKFGRWIDAIMLQRSLGDGWQGKETMVESVTLTVRLLIWLT